MLNNNVCYYENKKFYLRNLKKSDINIAYLSWFENKKNIKLIKNLNLKKLDDLKNYYQNQIDKKNIFLGIFESKTHKYIGNIKFEKVDHVKKKAYVEILLGETNYQNLDIGSKSLIVACDQIFNRLKIFKIFLSVNKINQQDISTYKKSGFYIYKLNKKKLTMIRNYFFKKIIIGTANFENNYGIVNKKKLNKIEKKKIFEISNKFNISSYDLSEAYNLDLEKINKMTPKNSEIYFKLFQSIAKLNIKKILSFQRLFFGKLKFVMIHGFKLLINLKDKEKLNDLKKLSRILPIGISVYSPSEIYEAYKLLKFKSVQVPANILDQRFLSTSIIRFLKKNDIQLCVRSIYLQGVLLQNKKFIKRNFPHFFEDFTLFFNKLGNSSKEKKKILTQFIFQNRDIDKVVIGFDDSKQFKDLIKILDKFYDLKKIDSSKFKTNKLKLIDPSKWNKN